MDNDVFLDVKRIFLIKIDWIISNIESIGSITYHS